MCGPKLPHVLHDGPEGGRHDSEGEIGDGRCCREAELACDIQRRAVAAKLDQAAGQLTLRADAPRGGAADGDVVSDREVIAQRAVLLLLLQDEEVQDLLCLVEGDRLVAVDDSGDGAAAVYGFGYGEHVDCARV